MQLPEHLNYTKTHEWLDQSGESAAVGMAEPGMEGLEEILSVRLPREGYPAQAGEIVGEIKTPEKSIPIHSPIAGEILSVNDALVAHPAMLLQEPYGGGWLFRIRVEAGEELEPLLTADQYAQREEETAEAAVAGEAESP